MDSSVVIIGAGPVGLMLAGELRLSGVRVDVYERRLTRSGESRGVGFTTRAAEIFAQRGLLQRFGEVEITRQGHFGGIPMDFGVLEGSNFGARGIPQYRVEEMLENWVAELGGSVHRGYELRELTLGEDSVTAVLQGPDGPIERTAAYLVGCDGGHSTVRRLAGFDFPGADAVREMYMADVVGAQIKPRLIGERVPGGMVMCGPLAEGVDRIIVCPTGTPPSQDRAVSAEEVAAAWERLTGESLADAEFSWVSAFTDATRQVTEYRRGRVLLAGDAAHIHLPAGGQGMSLGLQDAANLGWKLAATVHGWAPDGLLDSYSAERHPVGARVLRNTLAQGMLYLSGKDIEPLRSVFAELVAMPDVGRHLSGMVSGLDIRYEVCPGDHPLLGSRLPDAELTLTGGRLIRLYELLQQGRGVLLSSDGEPNVAADWHDRIDLVTVRELPCAGTESVLLRPDGYLAWAAPGGGELSVALQRWFGPPMATAQAA